MVIGMTSPNPTMSHTPSSPGRSPALLVADARALERAGRLIEAIEALQAAASAAGRQGEPAVQSEALRRLAALRCRDDLPHARVLCGESLAVAQAMRNDVLAGEALNTLGAVEMMAGSLKAARANFVRALELGERDRALRARVQQNLGILANIQGDLDEAVARYTASLEAYERAGDEHGRALAYHNLGMVSADRDLLDDADRYFAASRAIAQRMGDVCLEALCLVNHAEAQVARQRFEDARERAELALTMLADPGALAEQSGAFRVLGMVFRETGNPALSESRLRTARDLAVAAGSVLNQAEVSRELALLFQALGRNREALEALGAANRLFGQLDARRDLVHVEGKIAALESTYLAVVREWGESIESQDRYTYGHCGRVARYAVAVARSLGLVQESQATIRLGAHLHDVGKMKVPTHILNKPGPLTAAETEIMRLHPVYGVELLEGIEFPWDLAPIIRWHHERYDGAGYPDGLRGDQVPLAAQIVGIADVYDALTTDRPYRPGLSLAQTCAEMTRMRGAWSPEVMEGFMRALPELSEAAVGGTRGAAAKATDEARAA